MTETWRLLPLAVNDAYMNMAIDEAICRKRAEGLAPNTIRFYRWKPSAVSVGYFQLVEEEVNTGACKKMGIDIVRRMTGGGAVYHSYEGEVTYSIIVGQDHPKIPADLIKSYEMVCAGIVEGLEELGVEAEFRPINDITVHGKKISGNAQTRRWKQVLQHGTVLMDTDLKTMFTLLRISKEKISDKMIKSAEERVTTIRRELGVKVGFDEVGEALRRGFAKALGVELEDGELSEGEKDLAQRLREAKYTTRDWVFGRPKTFGGEKG